MKRWLKRIGIVLGVLVGLLVVALGVLVAISLSRESTTYEVRSGAIAIPSDADSLAEGERLWISRGCGDCHAADGTGHVVMDGPPARIVGTNLTVVTRGWPVEDHVRAIRHGVRPDGSALALMPSHEYSPMGDGEVGRIIAHYTRLPRRETSLPATEVRLLGRVLHALDVFPLYSAERIDHAAPRRAPPEPAETVEYGAHLAIGCTGCHGESLSGGPIPGAPPELGDPSNLTPHESGLAGWTREDFVTAMREGRRPDGATIDPAQMPWRNFSRMNDVELGAIWLYLAQLPPRERGGR